MAYVMLRMLEKFSKGKDHMYVKKRVGTKTSRRNSGGAEGEDDVEPEPEVGVPVYRESSFDFKNFERVSVLLLMRKPRLKRVHQEILHAAEHCHVHTVSFALQGIPR